MSVAREAAWWRLRSEEAATDDASGAALGMERRAAAHIVTASSCAIVVSLLVLVGWASHDHALVAWIPDAAPMKANTGIGVFFGGMSLLATGVGTRSRDEAAYAPIAKVLAVVPLVVGLATCGEYLIGRSWGLDQLWVSDPWTPAGAHPGRPSITSAASLVLVSVALYLGRTGGRERLFHASVLLVAIFSWLSLSLFVLGARVALSMPGLKTLSLPATVAFACLAYGSLWLQFDRGPVRLLFSRSLAGVSARRLIPLGATFPLVLALAGLQGERLGWYSVDVGLSLFTTSTMVGFVGLAWLNTRKVHKLEVLRNVSDESKRRLAERLRVATAAAHLAIWDWDLRTHAIVWDRRAHEIFGVREGSFGGTLAAVRAFVMTEDRVRVDREIQAAIDSSDELHTEYRIRRPDGAVRVVELHGVVQTSATGEQLRFLGTAADVTDRREAESRVAESEQLFRNAMEYAAIGMALVGLDGSFVKVNRALCELLGYSEEELLRRNYREIIHRDDLKVDVLQAERLLAGEISHYHLEKRYLRKDGRDVRALLSGSLVRDAAGKPVTFIAEIQDVSAQKEAETRLRATVAEKEVLLREIHHRVKNNLQIVSSMLRLQSESLDDSTAKQLFQDAQARIHSMGLIHERLYQSGNLATVDFGAHVRDLAKMLWRVHSIELRGIRLELCVESVELDLDKAVPLGLVCSELITNALKHAFPGEVQGVVRVELRRQGHALTLTVSDDGVGFPPQSAHSSRSLGMRLIGALSRQLRATLTKETEPSTSFTLLVPLEEELA